jgi:DNA-directed RNA polymerase delta subunit
MTGEFHGMSYTSAARSILERSPNKAPLTTQEILGYILKSGRKVEGKNPAGTIYSSLKRGPDFELVAKNTWGLAAWYNVKRKPKPDKSGEVQESEPPIFSDKDTPIASEMELQEVG